MISVWEKVDDGESPSLLAGSGTKYFNYLTWASTRPTKDVDDVYGKSAQTHCMLTTRRQITNKTSKQQTGKKHPQTLFRPFLSNIQVRIFDLVNLI